MRWLSGKSKSGETTHFVPNEVIRDTSDNPITFAHGLDIDDDSNDFAEEMKNDFNNAEDIQRHTKPDGSTDQSEYETARMIMEEADSIGESGISDEDKMIDLYNIYQNYEDVLSEKQRSIILEKISGIDKMIRLKDKNNKVANNIQNKIQSIIYRDDSSSTKELERKEPVETRSHNDDSKSHSKPDSKQSSKSYSDDDWYERSAMINAMAES